MPGSSQTAFLRSLEDLSFEKGRINVINPVTFRKAFSEWCYCQHEINILCGQDWTKCPPCTIDQHSCDVDGNQKVYRFSKVPRGPSHSYYCNKLIAENSQVDEHIRDLGPSQSGNSTQLLDFSPFVEIGVNLLLVWDVKAGQALKWRKGTRIKI